MSDYHKNQNSNSNLQSSTSTSTILCQMCYEFFGNPNTDNLCSTCFNSKAKEEQVETTYQEKIQIPETQNITKSEEQICKEDLKEECKDVEPKQKDHTKCYSCSKKVGFMGFQCKCQLTFCKSHRLPENHSCDFDFTLTGREKLKQMNPVIKAEKMEKI